MRVYLVVKSFIPQNLVQVMRDCFGSHTYERIDKEGSFHTEWDSFF